MRIELSGWNDGNWRDGEGKGTFGFNVGRRGRKKWFSREWLKVVIELPNSDGEFSSINIELYRDNEPTKFWDNCPELRHEKIKEWMIDRGM